MKISSCISSVYDNLEEISDAYNETALLRQNYFYKGSGCVIIKKKQFSLCEAKEEINRQTDEIIMNLLSGKTDSAVHCINELFKRLKTSNYQQEYVIKIFKRIIINIEAIAQERRFGVDSNNINTDTFDSLQQSFLIMLNEFIKKNKEQINKPKRKEINDILEYIDNNLDKTITCKNMAERVNMNSSYYSRLFKSEMGISFSDYLISKRIQKSTMLLLRTDMTIEEITKAIGLEQTSYFYHLFKKVTGKTPSEIRKIEF